MKRDDSQVVDNDKVHPSLAMLIIVQRFRDDVEVHGVHKVNGHGHHVRDSKSCKDTVGGRHHVSSCQDDDVDDVGDDSEETDDRADITMIFHVVSVELNDAGYFCRRRWGGEPPCHKIRCIHIVL